MKKHLKYIDGNSDKFWQIEANESEYTVTYGKNGTHGTVQTKQFSDAAECLKMAEKLVAEKLKKGYSENGEVQVTEKVKSAVKSVPKSDPKSNTTEMLAAYDAIIKSKKIAALLPFLMENAKGNLEILKKQVRKNKRFWMTYMDLTAESQYLTSNTSNWDTRGDEKHTDIITLSAIALFNKSEIMSWDEVFELLNEPEAPHTLALLQWSKPDWIQDYLLSKSKKQDWRSFNYFSLRFLEDHGLIAYNPELFCLHLADFNEWTSGIKTRDFIKTVENDPRAYQRDIPELFHYETSLQNNNFRDEEQQSYNEFSTWDIIFTNLLADGKLDRSHFIEQSILLQTKEWNNNLKSFFRKRLTALNPTSEELIPFQESIFACLHHPYAPVTSYAIELVKKIYENPKFTIGSFLEWLEPLMLRSDCKAAIKSIIPLLEKMDQLNPTHNTTITAVLANAYVIPDLSLQEKVTKSLLKIASKKDTALSVKLSEYSPLMQGNIKSALTDFLTVEGTSEPEFETASYRYAPVKEELLTQRVKLPQDWNDIVYLFGSFIASDEVLDAELLMNAYTTQRHLFPSDYSEQLQPYAKQLQNSYFDSAHKYSFEAFLTQKIADINAVFHKKNASHYKSVTLSIVNRRLAQIEEKIKQGSVLPLLSFPTHEPYWIAPKVLMERLISYQDHQEKIDSVDLSIAISRMPRENTAEALPLLDQLESGIKELMSFCLGTTKEISQNTDSFSNILKTTPGSNPADEIISLWAVAARTYYPEETFTEFEQTSLKGLPFVEKQFVPTIHFKERWNEYKEYSTNKTVRTPSWYELKAEMPAYQKTPPNLLYSIDAYRREASPWHYMLESEGNVYFWHSLMPQNDAALSCLLLQSSCVIADDGTKKDLKGFLHCVNSPGFVLTETPMMVFACCFLVEKKEIRLLASEILMNRIEKQSIPLELFAEKISLLASHKYGVFLRLADGLSSLKDISGLHNAALLLIYDHFFKNLDITDKLPVNFKKIVEHYIDVCYKTKAEPSQHAIAFLEKWKTNTALKPLLKQILK